MPGDFEFRAQQDLLARLSREVSELKRFAPSGVVVDGEIGVLGGTGGAVEFDGLNGGVRASILRINQWADIQFSGFVTSVATFAGSAILALPWPVIGAHPSQYTPIGSFDWSNPASTRYIGTIYVYGSGVAFDNVTLWYDAAGSQAQMGSAAPAVWQVGASLRGQVRVRIAPGY